MQIKPPFCSFICSSVYNHETLGFALLTYVDKGQDAKGNQPVVDGQGSIRRTAQEFGHLI